MTPTTASPSTPTATSPIVQCSLTAAFDAVAETTITTTIPTPTKTVSSSSTSSSSSKDANKENTPPKRKRTNQKVEENGTTKKVKTDKVRRDEMR